MPEDTAENMKELCEEYAKSLVEITIILQKTQEKVCNICSNRKGCNMKEKTKKGQDEIMQTKDLVKLTLLVETLADHITKEIYRNIMLATWKKEKAPDKGTIIKIE